MFSTSFLEQVEERVIPVEDLLEADEAFCTGTAVVVTPIGAVTYQDKRYKVHQNFPILINIYMASKASYGF